jgi:hypothetical protein
MSLMNSETVVNCGPHYEIFQYGTTSSATVETWKSSMYNFPDCKFGFDASPSSGNVYSCSKKYEDTTPYQGKVNDALGVVMKKTTGCDDVNDVDCRTLVISMTTILRRIEFAVIIR